MSLPTSLENCAKIIICGLSAGVRNALAGIVKGYIAELDTYVGVLQAKLVYANIAVLPIQALSKAVTLAVNDAKAGANIVPLDIIGQCVGIGDINVAIQANLDVILADALVISNDLSRLLSFRDEINAEIASVQNTINFFQLVIAQIDLCQAVGI